MRIRSGDCLEIDLKLWKNGAVWFWIVVCPHRNGGIVGAAATWDEAVRDARSSIED